MTKAKQMLDEELDEVKDMNKMMLYSKCVTIRDKQIEESKHLETEWRTEQNAMDLMMEIERLKGLRARDEVEDKRRVAQRNGALVIMDQIKERELDRIKEQEVRDKEMNQM